jgi:hypothetical protein
MIPFAPPANPTGLTPDEAALRALTEAHNALAAELESVREERDTALAALREDRAKWGWSVVLYVGRRVLDEVYPADIFTGASGDSGPRYIAALRDALAAIEKKGWVR